MVHWDQLPIRTMDTSRQAIPFNVMTKPIGPLCNLNCEYCFYLEKLNLYSDRHSHRMPDEVLERYIRHFIESQPAGMPEIQFTWQGGEPTLLGVEFFEKAVALQQRYANGRRITNAFQTNGTLLDDRWGEFLHKNDFLVGISIDGPRHIHDIYRTDKGGGASFDRVMRGIEILKKHKVEFNTLTVVNRKNSQHPVAIYRFLKEVGSGHIQFIPIVERLDPDPGAEALAGPPDPEDQSTLDRHVTPWSVRPIDYGNFLVSIFREWVKKDVGKVFVQMFEVTLGAWAGKPPGLCVLAPKCGNGLAMESNGDVYLCDHYVYPEYRLGNIMNGDLREMLGSEKQTKFGDDKSDALPECCRNCRYLFACYGGCPKHRFLRASNGEPGLNYLCAGYRKFFRASEPHMKRLLNDLNLECAHR